ncbi:MAG: Rrf2 family transcriptional regulator [Elusimicrobiota bacterium]|nr:Rrf2 family transcriptional regulator [Elusimicrobiota bacterium]
MGTILKISEAAVIAVHAVYFLAKADGNPSSTRHIASELGISYNHLTKVMQRLTRAGLLVSGRGPKGGFLLSKKAKAGKLRDVFEAIEGKMSLNNCLMKTRICGKTGCILGSLIQDTNSKFRAAMDKDIEDLLKR